MLNIASHRSTYKQGSHWLSCLFGVVIQSQTLSTSMLLFYLYNDSEMMNRGNNEKINHTRPAARLNIILYYYQHRDSHDKNKTVFVIVILVHWKPSLYREGAQNKLLQNNQTVQSKTLFISQGMKIINSVVNIVVIKLCLFFPQTGPRLNIKTVLSTYGDFHVKDKTAVRTSYL